MPKSKLKDRPVKLLAWLCFAGILATTLLAIVSTRYGWSIILELASHFQRQYFVFTLLLLGLLLLTRQRWLILSGLLCISLLAQQILPWYIPADIAPQPWRDVAPQPLRERAANTTPLRVLVSNLNVGNSQYSGLLNLVQQEQPDVVVLIEVNDTWGKPLAPLRSQFPYWFGLSETSSSGIAILSRLPLVDPKLVRFSPSSTPSIVTRLTVAPALQNNTVDRRSIPFIATHPLVPVRRTLFHRRNQQLAAMGEQIDRSDSLILVGDFNATMWSPYFRTLTAKLGLHNSRKGFGILPTWTTPSPLSPFPAWLAPLLAIPIDHCLLSPDLHTTEMHTGTPVGSDHLPIVVNLAIPG